MIGTYRITLTPDDNGTYLVECPALPEVKSFGETEGDCLRHAVGAIEEALAARIADRADVPLGDDEAAWPTVELPVMTVLKLELYAELRGAAITRAELARRLEWNRTSVDRLFMLDHPSRLEQIDAAAHALGRHLRVEMVPAA